MRALRSFSKEVSLADDPDAKRVEVLDPTPVAVPVKFTRAPTEFERIRSLVRGAQFMEGLKAQGVGTFEEEDDFDIDGMQSSSDFQSSFEPIFDPEGPSWQKFVDEVAPVVKTEPAPAEPIKPAEPPAPAPLSPEPKA